MPKALAPYRIQRILMSRVSGGALIGAGVGIGLTVATRLISGLFRRGRKQQKKAEADQLDDSSVASTPKASKAGQREMNAAFGSPAFGSPSSFSKHANATQVFAAVLFPYPPVRFGQSSLRSNIGSDQCMLVTMQATPKLDLNPQQAAAAEPKRQPGQLKQQLALIAEAQEENKKLRGFMNQYMAESEKVIHGYSPLPVRFSLPYRHTLGQVWASIDAVSRHQVGHSNQSSLISTIRLIL